MIVNHDPKHHFYNVFLILFGKRCPLFGDFTETAAAEVAMGYMGSPGLHGGAIFGIAFGCLVLVVLVGVMLPLVIYGPITVQRHTSNFFRRYSLDIYTVCMVAQNCLFRTSPHTGHSASIVACYTTIVIFEI